jgi:hypothetical protein
VKSYPEKLYRELFQKIWKMTLINSISARATVITRTAARLAASLVFTVLLGISTGGAQAECSGCLCPGNPCKLCPLPPVKNNSPVSDESDACKKIQEKVPPVSKNTEPNERYASLNKSIMECVRNGGDVLMNSRRSQEFPSKHYCKPYISANKANTKQAPDPSRKNQDKK